MAAGAVARIGKTLVADAWEGAVGSGALVSGEAMLRRIGPLGETMADMLRSTRDKWEIRAGKMMEFRAPLAGDLHKAGLGEQVIGDLERKTPAIHPDAKRLADYDRLLNASLMLEAHGAGIKIGSLAPDDYHHMWDPELFKGVNEEQTIQKLLASGQVKTRNEARSVMSYMQSRGGKVYSLETPRKINLPGYRRDLAVMSDHFVASFKRIEEAKAFGPKDEALHQIIDAIEAQHGRKAASQARLVSSAFMNRGAGYTPVSDTDQMMGQGFYRKIASVETLAHLGLAFLSHSGQFINTSVVAARSGLRPTIRAMADLVADHGNAQSFAIKSASMFNSTIHDFRRLVAEDLEHETLGGKLLRYTPFNFIDKQRRIFAARVGAEFVNDEFQKILKDPNNKRAITNLRLMGLDSAEIQKAGGIQQQHLLQAAKVMSDLTQFRSDALTLPPRWVSKDDMWLRLAVMYKQFFFHQAKFMKDQVLKPAFQQGEFRPLIYSSLLFPSVGEIVSDMKNVIRKGDLKDRPGFDKNHWLDRVIDNYSQVGGFGIMADLASSFGQPNSEPAFRFAVGPAISDIIDFTTLGGKPHPIEDLEKKLLRSVPVIGPYAVHKEFPSKNPTKGRLQRGVVTKEFNKIFDF